MVVELGIAVIFLCVGAVVGLCRRRFRKGFAELSYETHGAPVQSVALGLSLGVRVMAWRGALCSVCEWGQLFL